MKKFTVWGVLALILMTLLSGCGTTKGVGEDIEKAGKSIQESANKNS